jgi:anti-sigma B factor antagonist
LADKIQGGIMASNAIPAPELQLTTERKPNEIIVRGVGRISAESATMLQNTVRSMIPDTKRIVLDLTGVEYVDSSGLGALVSIYVAANNAQCMLELANPKPRVRDLFKLTKLASFFDGGGCIGEVGGI